MRKYTHKSQSTAMMLITSSAGNPTVSRTITIVTRPACGIPAAPTLAAVAVTLETKSQINQIIKTSKISTRGTYHTATVFPNDISIPFSWAIKIAATASYRAVPSMLIVAPTGMTNRVTRGSKPILSRVCIVMGIVAELIFINKYMIGEFLYWMVLGSGYSTWMLFQKPLP